MNKCVETKGIICQKGNVKRIETQNQESTNLTAYNEDYDD